MRPDAVRRAVRWIAETCPLRPHRPPAIARFVVAAVCLHAGLLQAAPAPEVRRDGPLPAQATGAAHTLRIIPETCHFLRGLFTGDAQSPYRVEAGSRGGRCQPRARLERADAAPTEAGWVLNDVLRIPHASCPGLTATVRIWRRTGDNAPPAGDAQGRARLYLQDEQQRAKRGSLAQLGAYAYVVASEGAACAR